jgi:hypothetical protein
MRLPDFEKAEVVTEKIQDYLLSSTHPIGKAKAAWFAVLGFSSSEPDLLKSEILKIGKLEARLLEKTVYGQKYGIVGTITGPNGKSGNIMTVWIVRSNENFPRFVTAFPHD